MLRKLFKRWRLRLSAVHAVLTTEYILISHIERVGGESIGLEDGPATTWQAHYRTANSDEHDFLVVKGEAMRKYKRLPTAVKADNHV